MRITPTQMNRKRVFQLGVSFVKSVCVLLCTLSASGCGADPLPKDEQPQESLTPKRPTLEQYVSLSEPSVGCHELAQGQAGVPSLSPRQGQVISRYVADRLGASLTVQERCKDQALIDQERQRLRLLREHPSRCPSSVMCGVAYAHRGGDVEAAYYLALADLAQRTLELKRSTMQERYEGMGARLDERTLDTRASAQSLAFEISGGGRCFYTLKSFQDEMREERRYERVDVSVREHTHELSLQRVFIEQRLDDRGVRAVIVLVDTMLDGIREGSLLQQELLCDVPQGAVHITNHPGLSYQGRRFGDDDWVIEVSGHLTQVPTPHSSPQANPLPSHRSLKGNDDHLSPPLSPSLSPPPP